MSLTVGNIQSTLAVQSGSTVSASNANSTEIALNGNANWGYDTGLGNSGPDDTKLKLYEQAKKAGIPKSVIDKMDKSVAKNAKIDEKAGTITFSSNESNVIDKYKSGKLVETTTEYKTKGKVTSKEIRKYNNDGTTTVTNMELKNGKWVQVSSNTFSDDENEGV